MPLQNYSVVFGLVIFISSSIVLAIFADKDRITREQKYQQHIQGIISSCEHGFQGNYWETYSLAEKYNLKFIYGAVS